MARRFRYAIKRSPKSDPQQYRVYRMENEAIGGRHYCQLQDLEIISLAKRVCEMYSVPQVKLEWVDLGKWAAEWQDGTIRLNRQKPSARSVLTILHELAHHVHAAFGGEAAESQQSHGAEFMACYISILDTARIIPVVGMRAICDAYKVRYADPGTGSSLKKLHQVVVGHR